jgi:glycosyltransferase involved in cell wall biosynthesis
MKKIVYIGNKLKRGKSTPTTIDTLSALLETEGFQLRTASEKRNKAFRLFDMVFLVFKFRNETDFVLIDTYSTQNFYYAYVLARCCKLLSLPYIPILHGGNLPERLRKDNSKSGFLFKNARINVSPSLYLLNTFADFGYENVVYIPNSIEIKNYAFIKRTNEPRLLWVRSFAEIYNPMLALKVVEQLLPEFPKVSLCMVGPEKDGALKKCKAYVEEYNLPVTFTGKLKKVDWINLSENYTVFINTTNFDNTPVSVIEAMALGLPVVSTKVGGIPFLLDDKKDALLVEHDNVKEFSSAVKEILVNPVLAENLANNARKKAETFDWEKVKHQWFKILD